MKKLSFVVLIITLSVFFTSFIKTPTEINFTIDTVFNEAQDTLEAKIVQMIKIGDETVLVLNKGSNDGIKRQDKGIILEVEDSEFTITELYKFRSKAKLPKDYSGEKRIVNIYINSN